MIMYSKTENNTQYNSPGHSFTYNTELACNIYINLYRYKFYILLLHNFYFVLSSVFENIRWGFDVQFFIKQTWMF